MILRLILLFILIYLVARAARLALTGLRRQPPVVEPPLSGGSLMACPVCGIHFDPVTRGGRQRFCSEICEKKAHD